MSGRHRKPTTSSISVAKIAFTGAVLGGGSLALAGQAAAATDGEWDQEPTASPAATGESTPATATTAACSSAPARGPAHGGGQFAPSAELATRNSRSRSLSACWRPRAAALGPCVVARCRVRPRATSRRPRPGGMDAPLDAPGINGAPGPARPAAARRRRPRTLRPPDSAPSAARRPGSAGAARPPRQPAPPPDAIPPATARGRRAPAPPVNAPAPAADPQQATTVGYTPRGLAGDPGRSDVQRQRRAGRACAARPVN